MRVISTYNQIIEEGSYKCPLGCLDYMCMSGREKDGAYQTCAPVTSVPQSWDTQKAEATAILFLHKQIVLLCL